MKNNFKLPEQFIKELIELAGGFITPQKFDLLIDMIEKEAGNHYFSSGAESNFLRIINALYDKRSFLSDAAGYPHHIELLTAIASNSNYLTDIIVRNPEYLYQLFDNDYLNKEITRKSLDEELFYGVARYKTFQSKMNFVRLLKRRYLLKIGANDILANRDLEKTTFSLSVLANAISAIVFELCLNEINQKYGVSFSSNSYTLCSLGKLGGMELNYSSDVDFILFYEKNEVENGKEYYEVLTEAVHLFVQSCMDKTDKGFLYRVDFRLRPDGKNSPLCRAYSDYMRYYESRGEDWERQMLIKAGFTGGSKELYIKFFGFVASFIYPSSFAESPVNQIRQMKRKIENRSGEENNIKLFSGGIRDIEFSIQALQLINGGRNKSLRSGGSLPALRALMDAGLISENEFSVYTNSYIFYRRIEHYLQLMNDTQTHVIPETGELPDKLARYFGFETPGLFFSFLSSKRKEVRTIYNSIMQPGENGVNQISSSGIQFKDNNRSEKNLKYLHTGSGLLGNKNFDSRTIDLFEKIFPVLKAALNKSVNPDLMLDNFTRVISSVSFPSIWYHEFENSAYFNECLKIFETSQKAADLLVTDKKLGELFLTRKVFAKDLVNNCNDYSLKGLLLTLSVQFSAGLIDHNAVSLVLGTFISAKLKEIAEELDPRFEFALLGLGSLATGGMTFESDADLIVIGRKLENYESAQETFQTFLALAKEKLYPFEVDFRLRPEGKKSPLVWEIDAYKFYLNTRARLWEYQAFSKIKYIAGSRQLFREFVSTVKDNYSRFDKSNNVHEVKEMHNKVTSTSAIPFSNSINLKKGKGGLVTLDFALHTFILNNQNYYDKLCGKSFREKVELLASEGLLNGENYLSSYELLKTFELTLQVLFNQTKPNTPTEKEKEQKYYNFLSKIFPPSPEKELNKTILLNKKEFEKITGK